MKQVTELQRRLLKMFNIEGVDGVSNDGRIIGMEQIRFVKWQLLSMTSYVMDVMYAQHCTATITARLDLNVRPGVARRERSHCNSEDAPEYPSVFQYIRAKCYRNNAKPCRRIVIRDGPMPSMCMKVFS